nr:hypothetical protein [uncultured Acetatifactor sp.]
MGKTISIGAQSFEFIRKNNYFFIDEIGFIKEWWENGDAVTPGKGRIGESRSQADERRRKGS